MGIRTFLVGTVAFVLLIWGPLDDSIPTGIRFAYLIGIPTATWFVLKWIWQSGKPDAVAEERLFLVLTGVFAVACFAVAVIATQQDSHLECTQGL